MMGSENNPTKRCRKNNPNEAPVKYVGFWARVDAAIVDKYPTAFIGIKSGSVRED